MDDYQKLKQHNSMKQDNLNELKKTYQMINNEEDQLREKIEFTRDDLERLDNEFNKIIETYSHIVKSFVRPKVTPFSGGVVPSTLDFPSNNPTIF